MMRGLEIYGREPQRVRFTPDGQWIYVQWLSPGTDWRMANGLVDTDVHSRDIVRPTQRFIAREQTGWDLAVYPVENHGSLRLGSRADEYRPIFEGFESTLTRSRATGGAQ